MASRCSFCLNVTLAMPSTVRSLSAGKLSSALGRALRPAPAAGRPWSGGVEGDVAFHLLHDLVDMAVQHRDRAEALQEASAWAAVVGAPAPVRIDRPQRDVGEDNDRRRGASGLSDRLQPGELVGAEIAHAAGLEVDDIDQGDEMHAVGVEGVPAGALGAACRSARDKTSAVVEKSCSPGT